jgi:hypothetical protein
VRHCVTSWPELCSFLKSQSEEDAIKMINLVREKGGTELTIEEKHYLTGSYSCHREPCNAVFFDALA